MSIQSTKIKLNNLLRRCVWTFGMVLVLTASSGFYTLGLAQLLHAPADTVSPTGETGRTTLEGYPIIKLPPGTDPDDENWNGIDLTPKPPVLPLSPDQELNHLIPPQGYDLHIVLTEPDIEQPGQIAFDGNGRMYVLELRTYMLDADATDELSPGSVISRHEDTDNDGIYDRHVVFADSLVFPRFVLPFGKDAVLTMESNSDNVYKFTDTDGDGHADKKEFFANGVGNAGNVEHQQASLYWGMNNWLYLTAESTRLRWTPDGTLSEATGSTRSQWGITQDNEGNIWFQGGASGVPGYFQFPIHYGNINVNDQYAEGFRVPYGAPIKLGDMQGGMDQIRMPDGTLNSVTGGAGNDVYRGDRLPQELVGQYFYGEPVARIVRRVNPVVTEGLTQIHNVYQADSSEFIRSTDPLFRPLDMTTAPDGTMYITDMYHGIIQEAQWTQPGDYLRTKIEQYQLDDRINMGRIFRLTYEGMERDTNSPHMFDETAAQLVEHLNHPNGWWRDKAQQLLVLRQDKSVVPALEEMVLDSDNLLARFHALWTLEGLSSLDASLVQNLFEDPNPRMRIQALRASETLYKNGDSSLASDYEKLLQDDDTDVLIQAMLTASYLEIDNWQDDLKQAMTSNDARGVQVVGQQLIDNAADQFASNGFWGPRYTDVEIQRLQEGRNIFNNLCSQCHGANGTGTPTGNGQTMAPSMVGSPEIQAHRDYVIKTLLHGMTGSINGKNYSGGTMVPLGAENTDEWVASVASYIRTQLSNEASFVTPEQVAEVREETSHKNSFYTYDELLSEIPHTLDTSSEWIASASVSAPVRIGGTGDPGGAFSFEGWTSGENQKEGMWFQVELPQAETLTEIQFDSPVQRHGYGPDAPPPTTTSPRGYQVEVSINGTNWNRVAAGASDTDHLMISFDPVQAKYVRITATETVNGDIPWNMEKFTLYAVDDKKATTRSR